MLMEDTRARMKNYRKEMDYTQEDLAKLMNVTEKTIQRYESGVLPIPLNFIEAFADLRKKKLDEVEIDRDETMEGFLEDVKKSHQSWWPHIHATVSTSGSRKR